MNAPGREYALYILSLDRRGFGSPALAGTGKDPLWMWTKCWS